ncbi:uncharacterized protein BJ171DRAFT_578871 [Polychytrium aggregatum]|uniref:uncharacterized protein n=1 Tax=Polychytrium aggregatum TaxID=110093 RepID=UPI0022FE44BD|nr:uncharacterized protein BJ171DRAFT_578871 [Polychytrium aggregatum]KAI9207134.1 hypothetical protein BJ171DRAFT_578871 [Polychytrium aggregatum]
MLPSEILTRIFQGAVILFAALSVLRLTVFQPGYKLFLLHPLLAVLSLLATVQALLWFPRYTGSAGKALGATKMSIDLHKRLQLLSAALICMSFGVVYYTRSLKPEPTHFKDLHSKLGLAAIVAMTTLQILPAYLIKSGRRFRIIHIAFGIFTFGLFAVTMALGLLKKSMTLRFSNDTDSSSSSGGVWLDLYWWVIALLLAVVVGGVSLRSVRFLNHKLHKSPASREGYTLVEVTSG